MFGFPAKKKKPSIYLCNLDEAMSRKLSVAMSFIIEQKLATVFFEPKLENLMSKDLLDEDFVIVEKESVRPFSVKHILSASGSDPKVIWIDRNTHLLELVGHLRSNLG